MDNIDINKLFEGDDMVIQCELPGKKTKLSCSTSFDPGIGEALNIDIIDQSNSILMSELKQTVCKKIMSRLNKSDEVFIDLRNMTEHQSAVGFAKFLSDKKCKNIVVSAQVGTLMMDVGTFIESLQSSSRTTISGVTPYLVGNVGDTNIFVDPMMRWTDNRFHIFDSIKVDCSDFSSSLEPDTASLNMRTVLEIDYTVDIGESQTVVFFNDLVGDISEYKAYMLKKNREESINELLK